MNAVLFICTGNFYRSRFAEALFRHHAAERGLTWETFSRGFYPHWAEGEISPHTLEALGRLGLPETLLAPRKALIAAEDLERATLRIAMDEEEHRPMFAERFPDWTDRVRYLRAGDTHIEAPETALPKIEAAIRSLVDELAERETAPPALPPCTIVMGVCGTGKTTIGQLLAERAGARFYDGDDFHPSANKAKMSAGTPLTDADRVGWLAALRDLIEREGRPERPIVVACSALREAYREALRGADEPEVALIHLSGARELIEERMSARTDHFMPKSLIDSQFATLEPPQNAITVDIAATPDCIVDEIIAAFRKRAWTLLSGVT